MYLFVMLNSINKGYTMETKTCQFCNTDYEINSKYDITLHKRTCKSYLELKNTVLTEDFLRVEYLNKARSSNEIALEYGIAVGAIIKKLKEFGIHNRTIKESKTEREKNKRKQTNIQRYGEEHNFSKNHPSRLRWEKEMFENEGITNVFQRQEVKDKILPKIMETRYRLGLAVRPELQDAYLLYKRKIYKLSEAYYKKYKHLINENNYIRGRNKYHLDHMVSTRFGFDNNIPEEIVAHPANLEMLLEGVNIRKGLNCSINIDTLYKRIEQYEFCENKINKKD